MRPLSTFYRKRSQPNRLATTLIRLRLLSRRLARGSGGRPWRLAEWALSLVLLVAGLYCLWGLLFFAEPVRRSPEEAARRDFRARLSALPPAGPASEWRVAARPGRWRGVIIHHTATAGGSPDAIDRFHRETNKWPNGLGYHFLIGNGKGMGDGEVAVGRRWREQDRLDGSHVVMADAAKENIFNAPRTALGNSFGIGVALVGDFREVPPTPAQLAALRGLLLFLRREYGIGSGGIAGHGRVSAAHTECPGRCLFVDEVVASLAQP